MNRIPRSLAVVVLATLSIPAHLNAAGQGARARGAQPVVGQAVPRTGSPPAGAAQAPPQTQRAAPQTQRALQPPPAASVRVPPPRRVEVPSAPTRRIEVPSAQAVPRSVPRAGTSGVVIPQVVVPRVDVRRPGYRPQYRPDYRYNYYSSYRPVYRPYYTFRPRVRLGFGIWVGYPVRYPHYAYGYPYPVYSYPYTPSYPYTYSNPVSIYSSPGTAPAGYGGLSFDIRPPQASVYIDGRYVGLVSQFAPDQPPLWLAPGRHHVEIREPGFEIIAFDVDIAPGQVIPYHGDLRHL